MNENTDNPIEECDFAKPEAVLGCFMVEMNRWERESWQRLRASPSGTAVYEPIGQELDRIFARYCTPKKRPQGRQNSLGVASPPDYDPASQTITNVVHETSRRASVYTVDTYRFNRELCYVLIKRGGKWLLDSKKQKFVDGWERWFL